MTPIPAGNQDVREMLDTATRQLTDVKHQLERWKREAADMASKCANLRENGITSAAFRQMLGDQRCYGLVFHAVDTDAPDGRPMPVVVPVGALSMDDPRSWPVVVEDTIRGAVQAQRSVHFEPLDPDERARLTARQEDREAALKTMGLEPESDLPLWELIKAMTDDAREDLEASGAELKHVQLQLETVMHERDRLSLLLAKSDTSGSAAALVEGATEKHQPAKKKKGKK